MASVAKLFHFILLSNKEFNNSANGRTKNWQKYVPIKKTQSDAKKKLGLWNPMSC